MALFRRSAAVPAEKKSSFRRELGLYTLIYLIFFSVVFLPVIIRDGLILCGDGYQMYYPTLINFRRTLIEFGSSIRSGSFRFPLMNFNYGFGTDNLTALTTYISCPLYYLSVLIPVKYIPLFLTVILFVLDYLAGIAFLRLCRHFGHQTYWNSLTALSYACATCFMDNYLFNPHFMYMLIALPLMVIGIDRIINKTGWRLLCFCVFWLSLSSFTLLIYTLPFLALFAFVRVIFVYKEHFLPNLLKAFLRCLPVLITGFLLSAVIQLPVLNLLMNSNRSMGSESLSLGKLLIPSLSRMSECYFLIEPSVWRMPLNINPMFIAIPGLILTLLVLKKHTELRIHVLIMIACVSVPLVDYGINGFQYSLIRWGCAPALAFAFAGSVGFSEFKSLDARQYRRTIAILCCFWITASSVYFLKYDAVNYAAGVMTAAALLRLIPPVCRLWRRFTAAAWEKLKRFAALLKGKENSVKRYLALAAVMIGAILMLLGIVLLVFLPQYSFYPQLLVNAGLLSAVSGILLKKKNWAAVCAKVLAVCLFASSVFLYSAFHKSQFGEIGIGKMIQMLLDREAQSDNFGRNMYILTGAKAGSDQADDWADAPDAQNADDTIKLADEASGFPDMFNIYQDSGESLRNHSLICNTPNLFFFHNMIDCDLNAFETRAGMTGNATSSLTCISGLDEREILYTLFGIRTISTGNYSTEGYGVEEIQSETVSENETDRLYNYQYALPLGVTYDSYMSKESYDALNPAVFPFALLQSAYTESSGSQPAASDPDPEQYRCNVKTEKELARTNSVGMDVYRYTVTPEQDVSGCFLYMDAIGCSSRYPAGINVSNVYFILDGERQKRFFILNDHSDWPWIRHTDRYAFPLGYRTEPVGTIEFELPMECEEISFYAIPASVLTDAYAARCEETLQNVQLSMNQIDGDITVSKDKLLSVSMIHNDGWSVTVDGKEAPLCKVNGIFLGVQLPAGTHHVRFTYRTPWLTEGLICAGAGILLWFGMELFSRKKKKQDGNAA